MKTWQEFNLLGFYDLDNFFEILPTPPVRTTNGLHVVERTLENQRLENTLHATVALSGKYRCGKTTLLKESVTEKMIAFLSNFRNPRYSRSPYNRVI
jgi:hypothetical protein